MAMFSSARLALRRAASLGAGLFHAAEDPFLRRLLHGLLLPRSFASDAFGHNRPSPHSGSGVGADTGPPRNFSSFHFVRQDIHAKAQANFNNTDNGAAMSRTGNLEKRFGFLGAFTKDHEQYSKKKRDFVHVLLKRKKTFVTVTESSGNKKTGASAGCLEDRKGRSRLSRYASEAVAEHVARKMGLSPVVMKVRGASFFKKKKKVILSFREGFRGERVRERSPVMYVHDVTQLPHNGCRLRKQRRI